MNLKNTKAQLEVLALALLVAGVVTVSVVGLSSISGGAKSRAEFAQNFQALENTIDKTEIFYSEIINMAARNALQKQGIQLDNFCPAAVAYGSDFKNAAIDESENLISKYITYEEQALPHMSTSSSKGKISFGFVKEGEIYKGHGIKHLLKTSVTYDLGAEYYITAITATVTRGGKQDLGSITIQAGLCPPYSFNGLKPGETKAATFSCSAKASQISATASAATDIRGNYVDRFAATIYTPTLSYLKISGTPAEKMAISSTGISASSALSFETEIPATAEPKPDLAVTSLKFFDIYTNEEISTIEAKKPVKFVAEIKNLGCVKTSAGYSVYTTLRVIGGPILSDTHLSSLDIGEAKTHEWIWAPQNAGTLQIEANVTPDPSGDTNNANNQKIKSLLVIGKPDLKITEPDIRLNKTSSPKKGDHLAVDARFSNIGTADIVASSSVHCSFNITITDPSGIIRYQPSQSGTCPNIPAPTGTYITSAFWTADKSGNWKIKASGMVDGDSDTTNNEAAKIIAVS